VVDLQDYNARWLAAWTAKDTETLMSFYDDEVHYVDAQVPQGLRGAKALRAHLGRLLPAIPDVRYDPDTLWEIPGGFCARWYGSVNISGTWARAFRGFDLVILQGERIIHNEVYTHQIAGR